MSDGYAVNVPGGGGLDVRTVGPTRRSAIVNWLHLQGFPMLATTTDADIEFMWRHAKDRSDCPAYCIKIEVNAVQGPDGNVTDGERAK